MPLGVYMPLEFEILVLVTTFLFFAVLTRDLDGSLAIAGFLITLVSFFWLKNDILTIMSVIALVIGAALHFKRH